MGIDSTQMVATRGEAGFVCEEKQADGAFTKANVPLVVKQNILWLQISVHNVFAVQISKCQGYFGGIETRKRLLESSALAEVEI